MTETAPKLPMVQALLRTRCGCERTIQGVRYPPVRFLDVPLWTKMTFSSDASVASGLLETRTFEFTGRIETIEPGIALIAYYEEKF